MKYQGYEDECMVPAIIEVHEGSAFYKNENRFRSLDVRREKGIFTLLL